MLDIGNADETLEIYFMGLGLMLKSVRVSYIKGEVSLTGVSLALRDWSNELSILPILLFVSGV